MCFWGDLVVGYDNIKSYIELFDLKLIKSQDNREMRSRNNSDYLLDM